MTLREFVKRLIDIQLGMTEMHIKKLIPLRDKASNKEYARGIQDCIDMLEDSILTGRSIQNEEIDKKERELSAVLEAMMAAKIRDN